MTRALLCLLLGGCVQVVPIFDQQTDSVSCCEAVAEFSRTTDGTVQIQNIATNGVSVKIGARWKF